MAIKFCVPFNYGGCSNSNCMDAHICAICYVLGHNGKEHTKKKLELIIDREIQWILGGFNMK